MTELNEDQELEQIVSKQMANVFELNRKMEAPTMLNLEYYTKDRPPNPEDIVKLASMGWKSDEIASIYRKTTAEIELILKKDKNEHTKDLSEVVMRTILKIF